MNWVLVGRLEDIPRQGSRVVLMGEKEIALFRTVADEVFALHNRCPHKGGPLSQGLVHGTRVTCPLHGLVLDMNSGQAVFPDTGCTPVYAVNLKEGAIYLSRESQGCQE